MRRCTRGARVTARDSFGLTALHHAAQAGNTETVGFLLGLNTSLGMPRAPLESDTNAEEREKGKTIEIGKAFFQTKSKRYTILDAPGHENYVPNMIKGASQADIGALIVSARPGEFEAGFKKSKSGGRRSGQTREHAHLAKSLGVE